MVKVSCSFDIDKSNDQSQKKLHGTFSFSTFFLTMKSIILLLYYFISS
jgi:hypothetical protein